MRKITIIAAAVVLALGAFFVLKTPWAAAIEPGVYLVDGNVTCATLNADEFFDNITSDFGFKIDNYIDNYTTPSGDLEFALINGTQHGYPTVLTGGAPSDPNNSVTLINNTEYLFDWAATLGIDAVIVKAKDSNAYVYVPEAYAGGPLNAPENKEISHIEFCYDYELAAEKTADAEYTRTYTWDITKDYNGEYWKFIGDPATSHGYKVSVDQTVTDSDFAVSGSITVYNPTPYEVTFSVSDFVNSTEATVTCDDYTLAPNDGAEGGADEETCTYSAALGDTKPPDGTNTATITSGNANVGGAEATADYAFGNPTNIVGYPDINVTDTNGKSWTASGDDSWTYSKDFVCSSNPADYGDNGSYSFTHKNTATIHETGQSDDATVTVNCYAPVPSKDANTSYTRQYDWTIKKEYDGEYWKFIGDPATSHGYKVSVDQTISEYDFAVAGTITVKNYNPKAAMTVSLVDSVGGTPATLDCGGTLVVPAATDSGPGEATCGYSADLLTKTDGTNTATATLNSIDFDATAAYAFGEPTTVVGEPDITVTDTNGGSWTASGDDSWTYSKDFVCSSNPADYTDGFYSFTHKNTATIVETEQSDDATVMVNCYAPVPSKDAYTKYTRQYDWTIKKEYDGEYWKFIGDPADTHNYLVSVDQTVSEYGFNVYGTITVKNYNPKASMTVSLVDYVDSAMATLDCGGTLVVPAATDSGPGEATCGYSADLLTKTDGTNTATATLNSIDFDATAAYAFGEPTTVVGEPDITVTDTNGGSWTASGDDSWTYTKDFVCSSNPADYTDGFYSFTHKNTATIVETEQSDDATVTVNCYAPVPSKTAAGTYDERHEWTVEKTVDPESQGGFPGSVLPWTWKVNVTEKVFEENFAVSGVITVKNYNPKADMTVSLEDYVGTTMATLDCGGTLVVPAATATGPGEATCDYGASLPAIADDADAPKLNTATATLNGIGFDATASIVYTANRIRENATLTDDEIGLNKSLTGHTQAGSYTFGPYTGSDSHTCSSIRADYFVDGVYTQMKWTITNWAYVYSDGEEQDKDDAKTIYTCDASFVDIYKTTNGEPADPEDDIQFALYSYDDGTAVQEEIVSTLGVGADLKFQTALVPDDGYTICEYPVPAAYTFEISVNGDNILTYAGPPGEENPTGEIQCFDFTADPAGNTLTFEVDNRYPGGAPRTPGYWKNWNRCTGGNQADTADKLNDYLGPIDGNGVFLLDDLLPQTIGDLTIDTCEDGVLILDSRSLDREKNMSNDAAYTLAKALLAARLNQDAGACVPDPDVWTWEYRGETLTFEQVLTAADELLAGVEFDGTGGYLGPKNKKDKDLAADALYLYEIIDDYNNSEVCTGEPSH